MKELDFLESIHPSNKIKFERFPLLFLQENGSYLTDKLELKDAFLLLISSIFELS